MKNKNRNRDLVINLTRTKDDILIRLQGYKHIHDYIRVSNHNDFDVCLQLTWQQHSNPFVEYYFLANIVDNKIIGKIMDKKSIEKQNKRIKLPLNEKLEVLGTLFLGLAIVYGIPFVISYAISDNLYLLLGLAVIPLLVLIVMGAGASNHLPVHKKNIIEMIKEIERI